MDDIYVRACNDWTEDCGRVQWETQTGDWKLRVQPWTVRWLRVKINSFIFFVLKFICRSNKVSQRCHVHDLSVSPSRLLRPRAQPQDPPEPLWPDNERGEAGQGSLPPVILGLQWGHWRGLHGRHHESSRGRRGTRGSGGLLQSALASAMNRFFVVKYL